MYRISANSNRRFSRITVSGTINTIANGRVASKTWNGTASKISPPCVEIIE